MRIILATEDSNLRLAVYLVLSEEPGVDIVGTTIDTKGLLALSSSSCPDVVLMDYEMGGATVQSAIRALKGCEKPAQVVVLGRDLLDRDPAIQAGADQFVLKGGAPAEFLDAIRST
jgi:two-component system chemotaxis response regulator CheB